MHIFIEKTGPYDLSGLAYPAGKPTDPLPNIDPKKRKAAETTERRLQRQAEAKTTKCRPKNYENHEKVQSN